jgi:hypothetical protein
MAIPKIPIGRGGNFAGNALSPPSREAPGYYKPDSSNPLSQPPPDLEQWLQGNVTSQDYPNSTTYPNRLYSKSQPNLNSNSNNSSQSWSNAEGSSASPQASAQGYQSSVQARRDDIQRAREQARVAKAYGQDSQFSRWGGDDNGR